MQAEGIPRDASDPAALARVVSCRGQVANFLQGCTELEAARPADQRPWTTAILALQGQVAGDAGADAAVVQAHIQGVRTDAPLTDVELGVLARLLRPPNAPLLITVYNPTYGAARGYCAVLGDGDPATAMHVRIAHVPAAGAGELNHWNAVRVQVPPPAGRVLRSGSNRDVEMSSAKRPRVGDV